VYLPGDIVERRELMIVLSSAGDEKIGHCSYHYVLSSKEVAWKYTYHDQANFSPGWQGISGVYEGSGVIQAYDRAMSSRDPTR